MKQHVSCSAMIRAGRYSTAIKLGCGFFVCGKVQLNVSLKTLPTVRETVLGRHCSAVYRRRVS